MASAKQYRSKMNQWNKEANDIEKKIKILRECLQSNTSLKTTFEARIQKRDQRTNDEIQTWRGYRYANVYINKFSHLKIEEQNYILAVFEKENEEMQAKLEELCEDLITAENKYKYYKKQWLDALL